MLTQFREDGIFIEDAQFEHSSNGRRRVCFDDNLTYFCFREFASFPTLTTV